MLTNTRSPKFKHFLSLKKKKERSSEGKFIIEGIHLVSEAHKLGLLDRVLYSREILRTFEGKELMKKLSASRIQHDEVTESMIRELSEVKTPQGIIASARPRATDISSIFEDKAPLILVACGIQDPGNLGTLIRTADAVGCSGLILSPGTVDAYNDKVIRATSGSIFHLNIIKIDDIIGLISAFKRRGITIIATVVGAETSYFDINYSKPTAILIGSEALGLPADICRSSDINVSIPMIGGAESLNAAVSGAIVLYEALRQRRVNAGKAG